MFRKSKTTVTATLKKRINEMAEDIVKRKKGSRYLLKKSSR
jgi:hypothetical protein